MHSNQQLRRIEIGPVPIVTATFDVRVNDSLRSIEGPGLLTNVQGMLYVGQNPDLIDLSALRGVVEVGDELWIVGNGSLCQSFVDAFSQQISVFSHVDLCCNKQSC